MCLFYATTLLHLLIWFIKYYDPIEKKKTNTMALEINLVVFPYLPV